MAAIGRARARQHGVDHGHGAGGLLRRARGRSVSRPTTVGHARPSIRVARARGRRRRGRVLRALALAGERGRAGAARRRGHGGPGRDRRRRHRSGDGGAGGDAAHALSRAGDAPPRRSARRRAVRAEHAGWRGRHRGDGVRPSRGRRCENELPDRRVGERARRPRGALDRRRGGRVDAGGRSAARASAVGALDHRGRRRLPRHEPGGDVDRPVRPGPPQFRLLVCRGEPGLHRRARRGGGTGRAAPARGGPHAGRRRRPRGGRRRLDPRRLVLHRSHRGSAVFRHAPRARGVRRPYRRARRPHRRARHAGLRRRLAGAVGGLRRA